MLDMDIVQLNILVCFQHFHQSLSSLNFIENCWMSQYNSCKPFRARIIVKFQIQDNWIKLLSIWVSIMFLCPLAYHVCKTKLEEVPGSYTYQIITEVSNITPCRAWRLAVIQEYTYSNTPWYTQHICSSFWLQPV